ncbi:MULTISPECIES: hypothetical protein [unclassified Bradyrhizobium]|uniref:hypothetical protein n=1 Tax=unclassified Bradyrhizobium TaxID=2631580 RepID=UPI002FF273AD
MDMRKYAGEQFIKTDDVREGPLTARIAFVKEGKYDKPDMILETGETLSLNATNTRTLVRAYGPNSNDWAGKDIELDLGQVQFQGKLQDSVIVKPVSPPIPSAQMTAPMKAADKNGDMDDDIPFN